MGKKLYVGNINYATTEEELTDLFAEFGNIIAVDIVFDRFTGQSRGFGFVEMETESAARDATDALNGREVDGRQLRVTEAKGRPAGSDRGSRRPV